MTDPPCKVCKGEGNRPPATNFGGLVCEACGGSGSDIDRVRNTIIKSCQPDKTRDDWKAEARVKLSTWLAQQHLEDTIARTLGMK